MKLAFLGIGLMGEPMVRRLLAAGYSVTVWNRTFAKAEALAGAGAQPLSTLAEAVRGAQVVISMLGAGPTVPLVLRAALPARAADAFWGDMRSERQAGGQAVR